MTGNIVFDTEQVYGHYTRDEAPVPDQFHMHTHDWHEVYCFLSGDAEYWVEGNVYRLLPGDVIICRSGESHRILLREGTPYERLSIHFCPELFAALDEQGILLLPFLNRPLGTVNHYRATEFPDSGYMELLRKAIADGASEEEASGAGMLMMRCHLSAFLCELYEVWKQNRARSADPSDADADPLAGEIIAYINENLFTDLSLPGIASHFFLSQTYVSKRFVRATGISVWNYVKIKRLHHARAAIRNGQPPQKVCFECGYRDYSSFYRAYLAQFGVSPVKDKPEEPSRSPS